MANSKYEYVRHFERDEILLPNTWIVVRIDGRGFHKLSQAYNFSKPNSLPALQLMNAAASSVLKQIPDLIIAYGVSDEFSFVFHKSTQLFERRAAKLVSTIVSTFTAYYLHLWGQYFVGDDLGDGTSRTTSTLDVNKGLPTFDGRAVCFPSVGNLRDYLCWRQVDCHINNLYNTTFWAMVQQGGMTPTAAEEELKGTVSSDKNEILWSRFGINYNNEPEMFKKGSVVFREYALVEKEKDEINGQDGGEGDDDDESSPVGPGREKSVSKTQLEKMKKIRSKARVVVEHVDIIKDEFWDKRPWILSGKPGRLLLPVD